MIHFMAYCVIYVGVVPILLHGVHMGSCIYQIRNIDNGKIYVGSTKNFSKRKTSHLQRLRNNNHHSTHLQRAYNKHGIEKFVFEVLEPCDEDNLFISEQEWIDRLNPEYNIGSVGGGDNYTNNPNKEEIRKKILKGLEKARISPKPDKSRDSNPNWKGGKTFFTCPNCGKETRTTGAKPPKTCIDCKDIHGDKNPFFGKSHSDETKRILREQRLGIPNTHSSKKCIINGIEYPSATEAARELGLKKATVSKRLLSKTNKFKDWYYV